MPLRELLRNAAGGSDTSIEHVLERLQNTPQLPTTSFTCVEVLCRTRHNTIDTVLLFNEMQISSGVFCNLALCFSNSGDPVSGLQLASLQVSIPVAWDRLQVTTLVALLYRVFSPISPLIEAVYWGIRSAFLGYSQKKLGYNFVICTLS